MSVHESNAWTGRGAEAEIYQKCVDWIQKKTSGHTKAEYMDLLMRNQRLVWEIVSMNERYEALLEEHHKLQEQVYQDRASCLPKFNVTCGEDQVIHEFARDYWVRFEIDPMKMNIRINEDALQMFNFDHRKELERAFTQMLEQKVAKELTYKMKYHLTKLATQSQTRR